MNEQVEEAEVAVTAMPAGSEFLVGSRIFKHWESPKTSCGETKFLTFTPTTESVGGRRNGQLTRLALAAFQVLQAAEQS